MRGTWLLAALSLPCCEVEVPAAYRSVPVPAARLVDPAARERGRALFDRHCALCHGERGDGRGERRAGLSTPPRDLTDARWQARTSPLRLFATLREGVPGTAMASWAALDQEETWDLVAYVRSLRARGEGGAAGSR